MKQLKPLIFFAVAISFMAGCKKDEPANQVADPEVKRLTRFTQVIGQDSFSMNLNYDNLGRVSFLFGSDFINGLPDDTATIKYSYIGNDTLISSIDYGGGNVEYLKYNSSGKMIADSMIGPNSAMRFNFRHLQGYVSVDSYYGDTGRTYQGFANGDIIWELDTVFGNVHRDTTSVQLTYDNNPNPFRIIALKRPVLLIFEHVYNTDREWYTTHNITEVTGFSKSAHGGTENFHWRYTYTYDGDGYPLSQTVTDLLTSQVVLKRSFYY